MAISSKLKSQGSNINVAGPDGRTLGMLLAEASNPKRNIPEAIQSPCPTCTANAKTMGLLTLATVFHAIQPASNAKPKGIKRFRPDMRPTTVPMIAPPIPPMS